MPQVYCKSEVSYFLLVSYKWKPCELFIFFSWFTRKCMSPYRSIFSRLFENLMCLKSSTYERLSWIDELIDLLVPENKHNARACVVIPPCFLLWSMPLLLVRLLSRYTAGQKIKAPRSAIMLCVPLHSTPAWGKWKYSRAMTTDIVLLTSLWAYL